MRGPVGAAAPEGASAVGLWFARRSAGQRLALGVAMLVVVAAIAVPLALSGGGGSAPNHAYPANVRSNFLTACETNASATLCQCAFQKIESQVSLQRFKQDELTYERTGSLPSYYRSVVFSCLG